MDMGGRMVLLLAFRGSKVRGASCGVRMLCCVPPGPEVVLKFWQAMGKWGRKNNRV